MASDSRSTDGDYLKNQQYRDGRNLRARVSLHEKYSTNPTPWQAWVFDHFDLPPSAAILEIGCGPGLLWSANVARIPPGWKVLLSDLSPGMVSEARQGLSHLPYVSYLSSHAQYPPFRQATFDAVIANHMLYHVPDVERALAAIHRLLKPGGVLIATTNGPAHLQELAAFANQVRGEAASETGNIFQRSIKSFTLQSGGRQLSAHFADVEVHAYPDSLEVDDAEAIMHYIESSTLFGLTSAGLVRLRKLLDDEMAFHGVVSITKESGLFIARKSGNL
jgi:SAM-dependent methyltransferase